MQHMPFWRNWSHLISYMNVVIFTNLGLIARMFCWIVQVYLKKKQEWPLSSYAIELFRKEQKAGGKKKMYV